MIAAKPDGADIVSIASGCQPNPRLEGFAYPASTKPLILTRWPPCCQRCDAAAHNPGEAFRTAARIVPYSFDRKRHRDSRTPANATRAPDEAIRQRILVDNPKALFEF
jgi:hypothetical protein